VTGRPGARRLAPTLGTSHGRATARNGAATAGAFALTWGNMPEYLDNPRRAVRAPLRCSALVLRPGGATQTATEDIGARGCQLVLPEPPVRGETIGLAIRVPRHPRTLRLSARVAWVSPRPPWRLGVAFAPESLAEAARWMETLISLDPRVLEFRRPPDRVPLDATVYLGLPPGPAADFTDDELTVLRTVGLGLPLRTVRERLAQGWPGSQRAIFSLLTRQALTLARASSSHPRAWRTVLGADGPSVDQLGEGAFNARPRGGADLCEAFAPSVAAPASQAPTPPPRSPPFITRSATPPPLPPASTPSPQTPTGGESSAARPRPPVHPREPLRHAPDHQGAGVGWRQGARPRSPEAQEQLNHGLAELELERPADALAHLRRALALAPGDVEIATAIGRAMGRTGSGS